MSDKQLMQDTLKEILIRDLTQISDGCVTERAQLLARAVKAGFDQLDCERLQPFVVTKAKIFANDGLIKTDAITSAKIESREPHIHKIEAHSWHPEAYSLAPITISPRAFSVKVSWKCAGSFSLADVVEIQYLKGNKLITAGFYPPGVECCFINGLGAGEQIQVRARVNHGLYQPEWRASDWLSGQASSSSEDVISAA